MIIINDIIQIDVFEGGVEWVEEWNCCETVCGKSLKKIFFHIQTNLHLKNLNFKLSWMAREDDDDANLHIQYVCTMIYTCD